jgi:hypothetical protein
MTEIDARRLIVDFNQQLRLSMSIRTNQTQQRKENNGLK